MKGSHDNMVYLKFIVFPSFSTYSLTHALCMPCRSGPQYQNILNVNVVGVFLTTKAFVPLLKRKDSRTVIQISSIFASVSFNRLGISDPEKNGAADILIAYNSSKAAVNMRKRLL